MTAAKNDAPLAGIRVLDLTQFLSGPYCTQMLADLGADVTKLEAPQGDLARAIPPHTVGEDSVYYLAINRNKKSVVIDMKNPKGLVLVKRLALASDIVVENFRPGVLARLGLQAADLRAAKPSIIWCSISGFGQTGPYREKPAYDMVVQALSGGMSLTGEPGGPAVRAGIPIADLSAGMYAASAILAALHKRDRTGRGDEIDISMLDCQAAMLCYQGAYHLHSGHVPGRQGSAHDSIPTYRSFVAAGDTQFVITANTERMWQGLCRVVGRTDLLDDPRFTTNRDRHRNRDALAPLLEAAFMARRAEDWVGLLDAEGIPVGLVNTLDRVVGDPQIGHRGMVLNLSDEAGHQIRVLGNPMRFAESAAVEGRYPPPLGAQTAEVLAEIGLDAKTIATLADEGAIVTGEAPAAMHAPAVG